MTKRVQSTCSWCGKIFTKLAIELHKNNFCCREHLNEWNRARIAEYNRCENPVNQKEHFTLEVRLSQSMKLSGRGGGKTYRKYLGRHMHRVVAESVLGRELLPDEVVHHIDGNRLNNTPENLAVMSRREHSALHARERLGVMP